MHSVSASEVITGKSQIEALMYSPSDSEVNTSRPGLRFPCNDRTDEVNKLSIIWPFFLLSFGLFFVLWIINSLSLWLFSSLILKKYL